jgi:hypothetical protein
MVAPHTHGALSIRSTRRATCYAPILSTVFQCNQGVDLVFDGLRNKTVEILGAWLRAQTGKSSRHRKA